ncbi:hypothetical protein QCA50_009814 [Cerrena zonata]|uniref:Protein kinase domain-containing protein n=1 Tax=Cerrena zonata TaxID=2478898 RepID=A0AAW0GAW2_9APHY
MNETNCLATFIPSFGNVHGDLRGVNILTDDDNIAYISGLGRSTFFNVTNDQFAIATGGAIAWLSPELLYWRNFVIDIDFPTCSSDVYSFACVCIELYTGRNP